MSQVFFCVPHNVLMGIISSISAITWVLTQLYPNYFPPHHLVQLLRDKAESLVIQHIPSTNQAKFSPFLSDALSSTILITT
jgi:hypothetical protein